MDDTVVTLRFTEPTQAQRALRKLRRLDAHGRLRVRAAALLQRSAGGSITPTATADGATLAELGGTVTRRPAREVHAQIQAAARA